MCLRVDSFCCCTGLGVGTKIIGKLSILLSVIMVLMYCTPAIISSSLPPIRVKFYWAMSCVNLLQIFCGCLLVYGAHKKKPKYMIPWCYLSSAVSVSLMTICIAGTVFTYIEMYVTAEMNIIITLYLVYALILLYCVAVVKSHQEELIDDQQSETKQRLTWPTQVEFTQRIPAV